MTGFTGFIGFIGFTETTEIVKDTCNNKKNLFTHHFNDKANDKANDFKLLKILYSGETHG